jgi:cellulose synthase (UDP-forming)
MATTYAGDDTGIVVRLLRWLMLLISAIVLIYFVILPLDWKHQLFVSLALMLAAFVLSHYSKGQPASLVLAVISLFASSRYIFYRFTNTLGFGAESGSQPQTLDMIFMLILLGAELYAYTILVLGFFQTIRPLQRKPLPLPADPQQWPSVDLFIPSYNEPLSVVRHTVWAAMNLDWPAELCRVYILDDGRREEFRKFAEEAGCGYVTRTSNEHAKAGNINAALSKTTGQFVAIFDCDHVPTRSFLQMTMGWFIKDERLAMVQTPHYFYSPDPFERNLNLFRKMPNEGELFYGLVQDGNDLWNATFFCGSCAVLRRTAIEEIKGIAVETVTEDAHTSLRMQIRGWNTAYINIPQAAGLATESLSSHIGQRIRWARGMCQILRTDNPLTRRKLRFGQRLCYFNAMFHFLYAVPRLIFLTAPLVYLLFGHRSIRGYSLTIFAFGLPHIVLSTLCSSRSQGKFRYSFWNEVYEAVLSPYILFPTLMALINPKLGTFNVTAKGGLVPESYFDWKIARPYLVLLFLNILGLIFAVPRILWWHDQPGTVAMNVFWTLFNVVVLASCCSIAYEREQKRSHVRVPLAIPVQVQLKDQRWVQAQTTDISNGGVSIKIPRGLDLDAGELTTVRFSLRSVVHDLPVAVVAHDIGRLRLRFEPLDLAQEEALTRILYSRADSWINATDTRPFDRPLRSLFMIVSVAMRGLLMALRTPIGQKKNPAPPKKVKAVPAADRASVAGIILLILLAPQTRAAMPQAGRHTTPEPSPAAPLAEPAPGTFHSTKDLASLGMLQPIVLNGSSSRAATTFALSASKVVTAATLHLRYRLAAPLADRSSQLAVIVNGVTAGSLSLTHPDLDQRDAEDSLLLPADSLLPENTIEFQLIGSCLRDCSAGNFVTLIDPSSSLEMSGQRLALSTNATSFLSPFLNPGQLYPVVALALPASAGFKTLQAAGIIASWLGINAQSSSVRFAVSLGSIPADDAVLIGTAPSLPLSLGLSDVDAPAIILRPNPSDPYSQVLIVTGRDDKQLLQAAQALALEQFQPGSGEFQLRPGPEPMGRQPNDAPRWLGSSSVIQLGDFFSPAQLTTAIEGTQVLTFRLAPDLYYGNRGSIPFHLNFRIDGPTTASSKIDLDVTLNDAAVASIGVAADATLIQHANISLPVSALNPYGNRLKLEWKPQDESVDAEGHQAQVMRNSTIDLAGIHHFVALPQLERFAESGYPFTRYADLSQTTFVFANPNSPEQIGAYLNLVARFAAETGYPALRVAVLSADRIASIRDRDFILLANFSDSAAVSALDSSSPLRVARGSVRLADNDNWWLRLRRSAWNVAGRTRQSIEDLLEADPPPQAVVAGFESPFQPGRTAVLILGQTDAAIELAGARLAGIGREGAVYGSISVLYNGRFESLYLSREEYQLGSLPRYQTMNLWVIQHIYLVPLLVLISCVLPVFWLHPWIERKVRLRLEGHS